MEWDDFNWTMEDKGREIFIFFELFCGALIITDFLMCKLIDFLER